MKRQDGETAKWCGVRAGAILVLAASCLVAGLLSVGKGGLAAEFKRPLKDEVFLRLEKLVEQTEKGLRDMRGEVTIEIKQGKRKRRIEGVFAYLKGCGLRVEYHRPEKQIMFLTDEDLNIYFPKINQLIHDRPRAGAQFYYLDLVRGFSSYFKQGRVSKVRELKEGWQVDLEGYGGEGVTVMLRLADALPYKISAASEEASTLVRFSALEINSGLEEDDLKITLPADVEVVELEGLVM